MKALLISFAVGLIVGVVYMGSFGSKILRRLSLL